MAFLLPHSTFIHTPKTAGQWVASALSNAGLLTGQLGVIHASPDEINQQDSFKARNFSFTFVRHPASWYQSMWSHRMDEQWEPIDDREWFTSRWISVWEEFTKNCQSNSFEDFIYHCISSYPEGFVSTLYDAYTAGCAFVGRHERLVEDLCAALDQAGEIYDREIIVRTKPKNVRGKRPHRKKEAKYSRKLFDLVNNVENKAIQKYGYGNYVLDVSGQLVSSSF